MRYTITIYQRRGLVVKPVGEVKNDSPFHANVMAMLFAITEGFIPEVTEIPPANEESVALLSLWLKPGNPHGIWASRWIPWKLNGMQRYSRNVYLPVDFTT